MKKSISVLITSVVAAALLAGCNGNNNNNNNGFGTACGGPPSGFQVLYPKPGAKNVGANIGGVYVAAKPALSIGNQLNFFVVQTNGNQQYTSAFATYSGSIPNPHVTPAAGAQVYTTAFAQPIGPLQAVNLYWNNGGSGCTPNVIVSSFSTLAH